MQGFPLDKRQKTFWMCKHSKKKKFLFLKQVKCENHKRNLLTVGGLLRSFYEATEELKYFPYNMFALFHSTAILLISCSNFSPGLLWFCICIAQPTQKTAVPWQSVDLWSPHQYSHVRYIWTLLIWCYTLMVNPHRWFYFCRLYFWELSWYKLYASL